MLYKFAGMMALLQERWNRTRINGIPLSWSSLAVPLILFAFFVNQSVLALTGSPLSSEPATFGASPFLILLWFPAAICSLFAFAILVYNLANKFIVFRKSAQPIHPVPTSALPPDILENLDLRVSGLFRLEQKTARRFLDISSSNRHLATGETAFVALADASQKFMGMTVAKLAGEWVIQTHRQRITNLELGEMYLGNSVRPALRFHYIDGISARGETLVLSFKADVYRDVFIANLLGTLEPIVTDSPFLV
jgi:hypothetical protein